MRKTSFKILYNVFFKNKLLNDEINVAFDNDISEIDKSFIKKETTGVIENIEAIDEIINKYSKVKAAKLNNDILVAFRLAIYEMLYMDKVPAYAVVNEYVNIIKKSKSHNLSSFVNAVLRSIERAEVKKGITKDKNCYFRIYNDGDKEVLEELKDKIKKYEGSLDFNFAKVYSASKYKDIIATKSFRCGFSMIEDASSIYLTDVLARFLKDYKEDYINVLDLCSAPGGKILGLIDLVKNFKTNINAVSCDISKEKIAKINENIERLVKSDNICIETFINDAIKVNSDFIDRFDLVMCDVPCTGLGVVDKKPDIKLNYSDKKRDELVALQRQIIDTAKLYVKNSGFISYSTCTETKEENEENVNWFLKKNKEFKMLYEKSIKHSDKNNCDGFYMAIMKYEH